MKTCNKYALLAILFFSINRIYPQTTADNYIRLRLTDVLYPLAGLGVFIFLVWMGYQFFLFRKAIYHSEKETGRGISGDFIKEMDSLTSREIDIYLNAKNKKK